MDLLVDETARKWRVNILEELFFPHETKLIRAIPLSKLPSEDKLIWHGNASGIFTVRSEYKVTIHEGESSLGGDYLIKAA